MVAIDSPIRTFDPVRLGLYEADAWVAYYRRRWLAFGTAAIGMVRSGFDLGWVKSLPAAWYVLRANQLWAPFPDNDAAGAQAQMRKFYLLVARTHGATFDVDEAAAREIAWWRAHREHQHPDRYPHAADRRLLVQALADLYTHVYAAPAGAVVTAAEARAEAMDISDRWVAEGCDPRSPLIDAERRALVRGYAALRDAVE
jgi:hypothetical protein